jgi:nucleoside-diphosphate-sugar epimerase
MTKRLFIFGLGYSGLEIARLAKTQGWAVAGTVTGAEKARRLGTDGIETHVFDGTAPLPAAAFGDSSHVLCTIAPGKAGDPALRLCGPLLKRAPWLGYLSTTGVYGDHGGDWVDEETPPRAAQPRSLERLAAEHGWQEMAQENGARLAIFRLPGIYGPGRSTLDQVKAGTARRIDKPGQFFSRAHVADIAAAVVKAMTASHANGLYNVADDLPVSTGEVVAFACELLGMPVPPSIPWEEAAPTMSDMARSFYLESRRVRNDKMKRELGVVLAYPTYREGLTAILKAPGLKAPRP